MIGYCHRFDAKRALTAMGCLAAMLSGCATGGSSLNRSTGAPIYDARHLRTPSEPSNTNPEPKPPTQPHVELPSSGAEHAPHAESTPAPRAPSAAPIATHPAALALLNEAMRQEKSGEYEVAAAKLERALRIEPRNPLLWHRLAALRLRQGQADLAVNFARKSNTYAAQDPDLLVRNQRIIEIGSSR